MRLALVYFKEDLPNSRKHHELSDAMLSGWLRFYHASGTTASPVLLLDRHTDPPGFWKYEAVRVQDSEPERLDVLNKVGWMKAQAFALLGKCVVMDVDAIVLKNIDGLGELDDPIAMSPDGGSLGVWRDSWPIVKYNAGVLFQNDGHILESFRKLWMDKINFLGVTYFDELIFSQLLEELGGLVLSPDFNVNFEPEQHTWNSVLADEHVKVLHFSGARKKYLFEFLRATL